MLRGDSAMAGLRGVIIPREFSAALGKLPAQARRDAPDSSGWVGQAEAYLRVKLGAELLVQPRILCNWSAGAVRYRAAIGLSGGMRLAYSLRYQYEPYWRHAAGGYERHRLSAVLEYAVAPALALRLTTRWYMRGEEYWSFRALFEPRIRPLAALEIVPWVSLRARINDAAAYECGLQHSITLHRRVRSTIRIGLPVGPDRSESEVIIDGFLVFEI